MTRPAPKALNRAPAPAAPASLPVTHSQHEGKSRLLNGSGPGSTGGRTNLEVPAKKSRRAGPRTASAGSSGPRFTLDSAFASVPALVASHDPEAVARDAKEEKAQRTVQELERL